MPLSRPFAFLGSAEDGLVNTGLRLYLDAGKTDSYPGTGTVWSNLAITGGADFNLVNTPNHTSGDAGFFTFNGSNQYATSQKTGTGFIQPNISSSGWTIETVFKTDTITGNYDAMVTCWQGTGAQQYWHGLSGATSGGIHWALRESAGAGDDSQFYNSSAIITAGNWFHMVWVIDYENTTLNCWLNNSHTIVDDTLTVNDLQPYNVGSYVTIATQGPSAPQNTFDGDIGIIRMYDEYRFTASDVSTNYNTIKDRGYSI